MPYYEDPDPQPRRRLYTETQARLEDELADLQAEYDEVLRRSEVPMYLKTCLQILHNHMYGQSADSSDTGVLIDTGTELKTLGERLAELADRMDRVITELNALR